jgi:hypothetical protein
VSSTGISISRVCAAAAVIAAATLGADGSAPAATSGCAARALHTTRAGRAWARRSTAAGTRASEPPRRGAATIRVSIAFTSTRRFPTNRAGWRPNASTRSSDRSRCTRLRASRRCAACTRPCTGRRPSRRYRPARRRDGTTSRPTVMSSRPSMRSFAASAGIAASSSSGTLRGAITCNGSSAGASTTIAPCAVGWSQPCFSAATSPSARSRTAVACSAECPLAGGLRSSPACSHSARSTRRRRTRRSSAGGRVASPASSGCLKDPTSRPPARTRPP